MKWPHVAMSRMNLAKKETKLKLRSEKSRELSLARNGFGTARFRARTHFAQDAISRERRRWPSLKHSVARGRRDNEPTKPSDSGGCCSSDTSDSKLANEVSRNFPSQYSCDAHGFRDEHGLDNPLRSHFFWNVACSAYVHFFFDDIHAWLRLRGGPRRPQHSGYFFCSLTERRKKTVKLAHVSIMGV